jgi:MarR family transcriptional regulator, lower aerobic nicotinate degradation pathway regulator
MAHQKQSNRNSLVRLENPPAGEGQAKAEYDFTRQVGHLLRKAYQTHIGIFQEMCADPQLTSGQLAVLCTLRDRGASSLTEIGNTVVMDPATTRGVVERLKERKLIFLLTDKNDRRRVITNLTAKGRAVLGEVIPSALAISERTMQALDPVERVALLCLLNKITGQSDAASSVASEMQGGSRL